MIIDTKMTTVIIEFEKSTPEIKRALEHLNTLSGVKIRPKSAWDSAVAEGAVSVDAFFDYLDARIRRWNNA